MFKWASASIAMIGLLQLAVLSQPSHAQTARIQEIITHVDVYPDQVVLAKTALRTYRKTVSQSEGSLGVLTLVETGRTSRFVVLERWKDSATYQASRKTPAYTKFKATLEPLLRAPIDERPHEDFLIEKNAEPGKGTTIVLTHVDVKSVNREGAEAILTKLAAASKTDRRALFFDIFREQAQTNHFTIYEGWNGFDAFVSHGRAPGTLAYRRDIAQLRGGLHDERLYTTFD